MADRTDPSAQDAAMSLAAPFFDPASELGRLSRVEVEELTPDYETLLAHTGHMTVTLEAWHESLVDVHVAGQRTDALCYTRHSILTRQSDGRPVQSGVMRVALASLPPDVWQRIEDGNCPLGRILIRGNVLREVELLSLWRIEAGPKLARELEIAENDVIYGRSARILVEGRPAVELLEIVKP